MKAIRSEVPRTRRRGFAFGLLVPVIVVLSLVTPGARSAQNDVFPDLIQLPADFGSEGIAAGPGHTFYVGSFTPPAVGQILVGDLRTGLYTELVPPTGRMAVGMKFDPRSNALFVAGGTSGRATVCNATSGAEIAFYQLAPAGVTIINDVTVTREAAYFTDSFRPFLGRVTLGPQGDPEQGDMVPLPANFGFLAIAPSGCRLEPTASPRRPMGSTSSSFT